MNLVLKEYFVYLRARKRPLLHYAADMRNHRWVSFNFHFLFALLFEGECLLVLQHTCVQERTPSSPWAWSWLWIVWSVQLLLLGGSLSLSPELGYRMTTAPTWRSHVFLGIQNPVLTLAQQSLHPPSRLPRPLHSLDMISEICCVLSASVVFRFITWVQWGSTAPTSASQSAGPKIVLRSVIDLKNKSQQKQKTKQNPQKCTLKTKWRRIEMVRVQLFPDVCEWGMTMTILLQYVHVLFCLFIFIVCYFGVCNWEITFCQWYAWT